MLPVSIDATTFTFFTLTVSPRVLSSTNSLAVIVEPTPPSAVVIASLLYDKETEFEFFPCEERTQFVPVEVTMILSPGFR
jgi:hypothetical protein